MIKIAGLQKMTLIDYPGKVAAIVFLAGCNFRCGYCHNSELVQPDGEKDFFSEQDFFNFLKKRKGLLDGVCITGGEPLCHEEKELAEFFKKIKGLGFLIKLDTNGYNFLTLKNLVAKKGLIDYIAMDVKVPLDKYGELTSLDGDFENIQKSIDLIMKSDVDYEFRTTILPKFHSGFEFEKLLCLIKEAKILYLQNFRNRKTLDEKYGKELAFKSGDLERMKELALKFVKKCEIRN
ncbi:MAG: anaerobic ribonucleoside-triphosphate reductase activating protein [Patescibacteria group bacterium]|nr:anaerobic ribonucleoside-triphosphate reductase activating protein [Patescibacteria group bacterium]